MLKTNLVIKDIRQLKDGSFRLGVITPVMNDEEKAVMLKSKGWQFEADLKPIEDQNDINLNLSGRVETRTPSQKLRSAIYSLWEKRGSKGDPEAYYRQTMASITGMVEGKLRE